LPPTCAGGWHREDEAMKLKTAVLMIAAVIVALLNCYWIAAVTIHLLTH
jgi:hypothetical protein